jgi:hypothetical protein
MLAVCSADVAAEVLMTDCAAEVPLAPQAATRTTAVSAPTAATVLFQWFIVPPGLDPTPRH